MAIPAESFFLVAGSVGTLQHQIRQMVTEGILSGRFRVGDKMPSSRGLAGHLPGRVFYDPVIAPQNYYRLAYCSIAAARIAEGIGLNARAIAETGLE